MAVFEDRTFKEVMKLIKMRSQVWALIQSDWYPYKKGKFGHRQAEGRHREKVAIYTSRERPQKELTLPTP